MVGICPEEWGGQNCEEILGNLETFVSPEEEEKIKPDIARWESGDPVAAPARSTGWKVEEEEELSQALTDTGATCSSCSS